MLNVLDFDYGRYHVNIPLDFAVTIVSGDSGSNKTFVFNAIKSLCLQGSLKDVDVIEYTAFPFCKQILQASSSLKVIDNADTLMVEHPDIVQLINTQRYQVLLFCRALCGVKCAAPYYGELIYNQDTKDIRFRAFRDRPRPKWLAT